MLVFDQLKKNDPQLRVLAWGLLVGMGILFVGLWYVQIISHRHYVENQKAQSFRTVRIPAIRGKILDRQGRAIAENRPDYSVSLYLEELRDLFKEQWRRSRPKERVSRQVRLSLEAQSRYLVVSNIVANLSAALREPVTVDFAQFLHHYTNQLALPLPVLTLSNYTQIARFHEHSHNPPGLDLEMKPMRYYPYHASGAHIVGHLVFNNASSEGEDAFYNYRMPDYRGQLGIEGVYDQELSGKTGVKSVLVNNLGYRQLETISLPAEPGKNVVLTIDMDIQQAAEESLHKAQANVQGAVVVMNPMNGDILALVSAPSYDPNIFVPRLNPDFKEYLWDENLKPERNRATQETYAPGSIFKLVVGLSCLEAGMDPNQKLYNPPNPADPGHGHIKIGRLTKRDTAPPGEYDFRRAFIKSSNFYFITNGMRYGLAGILKIGYQLHLGERTGLPTHQDSAGFFPTPRRIREGWSIGDTANLCIGQGQIAVTPLQMAVMVSAVANGGKVYWPRLVQRIESQDLSSGEAPEEVKPARVREELRVSPSNIKLVQDAMLADVEDDGTGKDARIEGFRVCGKTGTAQIADEHNNITDKTTWFASYAPYENPRYVVIVMVESGKSGTITCVPVAKRIYQAIQKLETQGQNTRTTLVQTR